MEFHTPISKPVLNLAANTNPSAVQFGATFFLFYTAATTSNAQLWWSSSADGLTWSNPVPIPTAGVQLMQGTSPFAIVFNSTLYVFYNGSGGNGIWYTTLTSPTGTWINNPVSIAASVQGMTVTNGTSPSAAVFGGDLLLFFNDGSGTGISYATMTLSGNNATWNADVETAVATSNVDPKTNGSAIELNGTLYIFYNNRAAGLVYYGYSNGNDLWQSGGSIAADLGQPGPLEGIAPGTSPVALLPTLDPSQIYVLWTSAATFQIIRAVFDGNVFSWEAPVSANDVLLTASSTASPCLAQFNNLFFLFWKSGQGLEYCPALALSASTNPEQIFYLLLSKRSLFITVDSPGAFALIQDLYASATSSLAGSSSGSQFTVTPANTQPTVLWTGPTIHINLPSFSLINIEINPESSTSFLIDLLYAAYQAYHGNYVVQNNSLVIFVALPPEELQAPQQPVQDIAAILARSGAHSA